MSGRGGPLGVKLPTQTGGSAPVGITASPVGRFPTILANTPGNTVLANLTEIGGTGHSVVFSLTAGSDSNLQVVGTQLLTVASPSFTPGTTPQFGLSVTDSGGTYTEPHTARTYTCPAGPTAITLTGNTVNANAVANTFIGAIGMTGGTPPATWSSPSNNKFETSGNTLDRSNTGTLTAGVNETTNLAVTDAAGLSTDTATNGQGPFTIIVNNPAAVSEFTVANFAASSTKALVRIPLVFGIGAVPWGQALSVNQAGTACDAQFDQRVYWDDNNFTGVINSSGVLTATGVTGSGGGLAVGQRVYGPAVVTSTFPANIFITASLGGGQWQTTATAAVASMPMSSDGSLKMCVCHMRDNQNSGLYNANESRPYTVGAAVGSWPNTGVLSLSALLAVITAHDFKVKFTNLTSTDGSVVLNSIVDPGANITAVPTKTAITDTPANPTLYCVVASGATAALTLGSGPSAGTVTGVTVTNPAYPGLQGVGGTPYVLPANLSTAGITIGPGGRLPTISFKTNNLAQGSGSYTASFNSHSAVATRITQDAFGVPFYHCGQICQSIEVWGMATDDTGGLAHPSLKTRWYITVWFNANGTVYDIEHAAEVTQDWWAGVPAFGGITKARLDYNAAYYDGGSLLYSYQPSYVTDPVIHHPYHSKWITVRTQNDNNHAKRLWAGGTNYSGPTVVAWRLKSRDLSSGLYPPINPSYNPNSIASGGNTNMRFLYQPIGMQGHDFGPDNVGSHMGRGMICNSDGIAWMQSDITFAGSVGTIASNYMYARISGLVGLHVPYHAASQDNRTIASGPAAGTDIANTIIPLVMRPLQFSASYTFNGMPAPSDAYSQGNQSSPPITGTWQYFLGGGCYWQGQREHDPNANQYQFSGTQDSSHAIGYSFWTYLREGERHFMNATLDLMTALSHQALGEAHQGCPIYMFSNTLGSGNSTYALLQPLLGIPASNYGGGTSAPQYGGIGSCRNLNSYRSMAWDAQLAAQAFVCCPTADIQAEFVRLSQRMRGVYLQTNIQYMPPDLLGNGYYLAAVANNLKCSMDQWQNSFVGIAYSYAAIACNDPNYAAVCNYVQSAVILPWANGQPYAAENYIMKLAPYTTDIWRAADDRYFVPQDCYQANGGPGYSVLADGNGDNTIISESAGPIWGPWTAGDEVRFTVTDWHDDICNIPMGHTRAGDPLICPSTTLTANVSNVDPLVPPTLNVADSTVFDDAPTTFGVLIGKEYFEVQVGTRGIPGTLTVISRAGHFLLSGAWPATTHSSGDTVQATLYADRSYYSVNPGGSYLTNWTTQIARVPGGDPIILSTFGTAANMPQPTPQAANKVYSVYKKQPAYWTNTPASTPIGKITADDYAPMNRAALYCLAKVPQVSPAHSNGEPVYINGQPSSVFSTTLGQSLLSTDVGNCTVGTTVGMPSGLFVIMVGGTTQTLQSQTFLRNGELMLVSVVDPTTINIMTRGNLINGPVGRASPPSLDMRALSDVFLSTIQSSLQKDWTTWNAG